MVPARPDRHVVLREGIERLRVRQPRGAADIDDQVRSRATEVSVEIVDRERIRARRIQAVGIMNHARIGDEVVGAVIGRPEMEELIELPELRALGGVLGLLPDALGQGALARGCARALATGVRVTLGGPWHAPQQALNTLVELLLYGAERRTLVRVGRVVGAGLAPLCEVLRLLRVYAIPDDCRRQTLIIELGLCGQGRADRIL